MPWTAHIPVPRSQIGSPTEIGGPSGSPVTYMIPPMPCAIRSKPPRPGLKQSSSRELGCFDDLSVSRSYGPANGPYYRHERQIPGAPPLGVFLGNHSRD